MTEPLPLDFLGTVRQLAEPDELMKFTLIYDGDLPSAGNKPKPMYSSHIRNVFHDQLADLWDSHVILRQLARTARTESRVLDRGNAAQWDNDPHWPYEAPGLPDFRGPIEALGERQVDFCAPIPVPGVGRLCRWCETPFISLRL